MFTLRKWLSTEASVDNNFLILTITLSGLKYLYIIKYEKPEAIILNILLNDQALQYLVELNLSHLTAHVVNRLLREKRKSVPNYFNGKKLLKNVTLQILNFILVS